jgi:endonuclease YncB( thermonuclease family)
MWNIFLGFILFLLVVDCDAKPDYHTVKWVYDGDTLLLKDGRKIRLIGINTPEVAHHKKKGQPYGREATEALRQLLKTAKYKIRLERGEQRYDRYKRSLAYVFLPDGTDVSQWMLQQGWATLMTFPPNIRYVTAYKKAEGIAQQNKRHIWQHSVYHVKTVAELKRGYRGYIRLKSTVQQIKLSKKSIILELEQKIFIKLSRQPIHYFNRYDLKKLRYQGIIVSGFLRKYRGKRIITVRHPVQLKQ